ncbi:hypothetical protein Dimus_010747, partial [Dionaea muscipula]
MDNQQPAPTQGTFDVPMPIKPAPYTPPVASNSNSSVENAVQTFIEAQAHTNRMVDSFIEAQGQINHQFDSLLTRVLVENKEMK